MQVIALRFGSSSNCSGLVKKKVHANEIYNESGQFSIYCWQLYLLIISLRFDGMSSAKIQIIHGFRSLIDDCSFYIQVLFLNCFNLISFSSSFVIDSIPIHLDSFSGNRKKRTYCYLYIFEYRRKLGDC